MSKRRKSIISTYSAQITSTISVTLVLLILGIVAMLGVAAHNITNDFKGNVGFVVMLDEQISTGELNALKQKWRKEPYVAAQRFIPAEEVFKNEMKEMGEEVLELMAGINPYQPEFEITVKPQYACRDSINNIKASLAGINGIDEVLYDTSDIDAINNNINKGILILSIIAAALILISFVLINNTVRLTVYSKRFIIHTMKLVGASWSFIRRPFLVRNVWIGVLAGIMADAILLGMAYMLVKYEPQLIEIITPNALLVVMASVFVFGLAITFLCAYISINKYLRMKASALYYI